MRAVYATQFRIHGTNFDEISQHVDGWLEDRYRSKYKNPVEVQHDGNVQRPMDGHRLKVNADDIEGGYLMQVEWKHPDSRPGANLDWQTEVMVAAKGDELEFGIVIRVGSSSFAVQPIGRIHLGTPGIVRALMQQYNCRSAGVEITADHTRVTASEVDMLVNHILYPDRALPIVLISRDEDDQPARPVSIVQDKLLGLAHVYDIERVAGYELTRQLGKSSSCFDGAIRVYWPGFKPSSYVRHPLYLPDQIAAFEAEDRLLEEYLFRKFAGIAASRFSEGKVWRQLRKQSNRRKLEEVDRLRARVRNERTKAKQEEEQLLDEMEDLLNQNEGLIQENDNLQERMQELEDEIATARENLLASYQYSDDSETEAELDETGVLSPSSLDSVSSALRKAGEDFEERVIVWDSALESAEASDFARPKEVYNAMQAIARLADRYYKGEDRSTGTPWDEYFDQLGFKYAAQESDSTMNHYGEDRIFAHDGERQEMQRHLTLGGGSRKNCLQIFFDIDNEQERFAVGYCGVHLPYYSQRT